MPKSPRKRKSPNKRALKPCQPTQERNPNTNRCVKKCPVNSERHPDNFNKYDYSLLPNEFKSEDKISYPSAIRGGAGIFNGKYVLNLEG
jgi:hypothetical protein